MNYREIKSIVCAEVANYLYSLEIYDVFEEKDADKVDRAIFEIQAELLRRFEKRARKSK